MPGLFDYQNPDDMAFMALASGLLGGKGNLGSIIGKSMLGSQAAYQSAAESKGKVGLAGAEQERIRSMLQQMEDERRKRQSIEGAARGSMMSPEIVAAQGGPTLENAAKIPAAQPQFDQKGFLQKLFQIDPLMAQDWQAKVAPKPVDLIKLGRDDRLVSPTGQEIVGAGPEKAEKAPADWQLYQLSGAPQKGVGFDEWNRANRRSGASNIGIGKDNLGLSHKDRFDMEGKLADDYKGITKLDNLVLSASGKIRAALSQTGAIKDQAAIYSFAKLLDPDGAVREADYAAITNTAGLVDRVKNYLNNLLTGEKLNPVQRQEMLTLMDNFERVANERITAAQSDFGDQAKRYNLRPEAVTAGSKRTPATPKLPSAPVINADAVNAELKRRGL